MEAKQHLRHRWATAVLVSSFLQVWCRVAMQRAAREATEAARQLQIVCVVHLDAAGYRHHPKPHVRESEPLVCIRGETRPHHPHHLHHVVYSLIHELKECSALLSTSLSAVEKEKQQCKVGREEEGSSSNQPELAAFFLALCDTLVEEPLLFLCDNQSLLKAVNRWIGEGGKATLVGAPEVDILAAAIEILRKRIAVGTATFLLKVKAHRGEPANEGAYILVDKAISDLKVGKE